MAKAKKKSRPPRRTKASKRLARYQYKLDTLRKYVSGFDAKSHETLYEKKPRTEAGKLAKRRALAKFNARFRQLKPYVTRSLKRVEPKGRDRDMKLEALREYAGVPKIKGLRAVPIELTGKTAKVSVSRRGRVSVTQGRVKETVYRLPRRPRKRLEKLPDGSKRFLTPGEDAREMVRAMLDELPDDGIYLVVTSEYTLIPTATDKEGLLKELDTLIHKYEATLGAPWLLPKILGVKRVLTDTEGFFNYAKALKQARTKSQAERAQRRRAQHEKAAFKLGKQTKRGKATGRR